MICQKMALVIESRWRTWLGANVLMHLPYVQACGKFSGEATRPNASAVEALV